MQRSFPKKNSTLKPNEKAVIAAYVLHRIAAGEIDDKEAGQILRREIGLQWTFLTAIQYLTGKEAAESIASLPANQHFFGLTKNQIIQMLAIANHLAANIRADGRPLTPGFMVHLFKEEKN